MSGRSSQASAAWTKDSDALDISTSSSAKGSDTPVPTPTLAGSPSTERASTAEPFSPNDFPESPSSATWRLYVSNQRREIREMDVSPSLTEPGGFTQSPFLVSSPAGSPAKTSASPDDAQDSPGSDQDSSLSSPESLSLFDPDGFSSRTYPVSSLATAVGTLESCLERWPTSGTAWLGGLSTHVSSECRSAAGVCSSSEPSLTEILEPPPSVPERYSLSARAAQGILRRAAKRGRTLPPHLEEALATVAGTTATRSTGGGRLSGLSGMGSGGADDNDAQAGRLVTTYSGHGEDEAQVANALKVPSHGASWSGGSSDTFVVARALTSHPDRQDATVDNFVTHALTSEGHDASEDGTGRGTPLVAAPLTAGGHPNSNEPGRRKEDDVNLAVSSVGVRRLTPRECERLQGLPDDWTQLGDTADSRRYSAVGDAVTVNVAEWIGGRLP